MQVLTSIIDKIAFLSHLHTGTCLRLFDIGDQLFVLKLVLREVSFLNKQV